jgi:hypothetical protein
MSSVTSSSLYLSAKSQCPTHRIDTSPSESASLNQPDRSPTDQRCLVIISYLSLISSSDSLESLSSKLFLPKLLPEDEPEEDFTLPESDISQDALLGVSSSSSSSSTLSSWNVSVALRGTCRGVDPEALGREGSIAFDNLRRNDMPTVKPRLGT